MRGLLLLFVLPASGFSPGRKCGPRRGASVMHETIRERLNADMKTAMKAKEKERLAAIRSMTAAIKQKEVDDRGVEVDDAMTIDLLSKLLKQRRESIQSYTDGGRDELVAEETFAAGVIQEYLPEPLSEEELEAIISAAIEEVGATELNEAMHVNNTLRQLLLSYNKIKETGAAAVASAVAVNTTLHTLKLADNDISEQGALRIAEALALNSTIHTLDLLGNSLTKKVEDMLDKIMRTSNAYVTIPSEFQVRIRCAGTCSTWP